MRLSLRFRREVFMLRAATARRAVVLRNTVNATRVGLVVPTCVLAKAARIVMRRLHKRRWSRSFRKKKKDRTRQ